MDPAAISELAQPPAIRFTLGEWPARYARDPATREDRLIPVVVGPVSQANLLDPILHADLSPHAAPGYHRLIRHLALARRYQTASGLSTNPRQFRLRKEPLRFKKEAINTRRTYRHLCQDFCLQCRYSCYSF